MREPSYQLRVFDFTNAGLFGIYAKNLAPTLALSP